MFGRWFCSHEWLVEDMPHVEGRLVAVVMACERCGAHRQASAESIAPVASEAAIRRIVREELAAIEAERRTPEARQARIKKVLASIQGVASPGSPKEEGGTR